MMMLFKFHNDTKEFQQALTLHKKWYNMLVLREITSKITETYT